MAVLEAVRVGHADIGIFSGLTEASGVQTLPYRRDTLVVAMPADHPLATRSSLGIRDIVGEDFVSLQQGSSIQAFLERRADEIGARIQTQVQVQNFDGVRRMVQARLGIAVLPYGAVEPYMGPARLAMIPIDAPWATRDLLIAVRDLSTVTPPNCGSLVHPPGLREEAARAPRQLLQRGRVNVFDCGESKADMTSPSAVSFARSAEIAQMAYQLVNGDLVPEIALTTWKSEVCNCDKNHRICPAYLTRGFCPD